MKNGHLVLVNQLNQTVRHFQWDGDQATAVIRHDTGRVEIYEDLTPLVENNIIHTSLVSFTKADLKKDTPVALGKSGSLMWVDEVSSYPASVVLDKEEKNRDFIAILKKTAAANFALLLPLVLIGYFYKATPKVEEVVVTVERQAAIKELHRPTVSLSEKKITQYSKNVGKHVRIKNLVSKKISHRPNKVANKAFGAEKRFHVAVKSNQGSGGPNKNLTGMGALGALGGKSAKGLARNGLNLSQVKGAQAITGSGLTATDRAVYGNGMIAASNGMAARGQGSGGLGTRGNGTGQGGYGNIDLIGSPEAYFQPLESQALVQGGLDRGQVAEVIRRNMGQIVYCYEKGLQSQPSLKGRVSVYFVIGGQGLVSLAEVAHSSLRSDSVEGCIVGKLKRWKFPRPEGNVNVKVTYPFVLRRLTQG